MASYFRPLRGTRASALEQLDGNAPLKNGEVFFEYPDGGPGSGPGKIKMGDANGTPYSELPYFIDPTNMSGDITDSNIDECKIEFQNSTAPSSDSDDTLLEGIAPASTTNTIFKSLKQLLLNFSAKIKNKADVQTDPGSGYGFDGYAKGVYLDTDRGIGWDTGEGYPFHDFVTSRPSSELNYVSRPNDLPTSKAVSDYVETKFHKGILADRWPSIGDVYPGDKQHYEIPLSDLIPDMEYYDGNYIVTLNATIRSWNRTLYKGNPVADGIINVDAFYNQDTRQIECTFEVKEYFMYMRFCEVYITYIAIGAGGEPKYTDIHNYG